MKKLTRGLMPAVMLNGLSMALGLMLLVTTAEAQEDIEQGKMLFESRCAVCHQLPEPAMLKLDQWQRSLNTMQKRMQSFGMSPLTELEFQQVLAYLATQVRD